MSPGITQVATATPAGGRNPIPFSAALRHRASLRAYAIRCTRSLGLGHLYDVDDLLQAVWLRALERWNGPSGPRDPHPRAVCSWLHRMMLRHAQTESSTGQRRQRILTQKRTDVMQEVHGASQASQEPTKSNDSVGEVHPRHNAGSRACHDPRAALAARLDAHKALAALSPETRELVVRAHAADDEYREIAADRGMLVSTVTSRLHRGRLVAAAALSEPAPARPVVAPQPSASGPVWEGRESCRQIDAAIPA